MWAGRGVQLGAGLVEMALANRARSIVGRHLLDVAVIAAVLMIVLGGLVGGPGVTSFGWIVLLTNRVHPTRFGTTADAIKTLRRAVGDAVVAVLG